MAYFCYRPRKQRPKTRCSISFMEENAYREDKMLNKTIYVGTLTSKITKKEVKEYFLKFGTVSSVAIKRTRSKRATWFYAFVTFTKTKSAKKALRLAKHKIQNRRVVVNAAGSCIQPKKKDAKCKRNKYSLLDLNEDCLNHIASFLELRDLLNLSKTCKRLECGLKPAFASYKELDTDSLRGLTLMEIREILCKIGPHVQHIVCCVKSELNRRRFEEHLEKYCVAANIVSLEFYSVHPLSKEFIQSFNNLKTLSCSITDYMSAVLPNCKNLQNLDLCETQNFTGIHLDKLSNLQNLNLVECFYVWPESFKNLCINSKLVSLNIAGCGRLDNSSIETLASTQTKLENLSISNDYFGAPNLSPLATLKNLKRLRIECCGKNCDEFFQELAKHRGAELEVLVIWECSFNQKEVEAICSLKKLKVLAVICCENTTSMLSTTLGKISLECLFIGTLELILEEDVLNLIGKSETLKVIAGDTYHKADKRGLVLSAHEIINKMERKCPLSLFTQGPCVIDGIFHEEPITEGRRQREYRKIMKKFGYLDSLPEWFDLHNYFY